MISSRRFLIAVVLCALFSVAIRSQSSAFTYQGKLTDASLPANGQYDFQFGLYDSAGTLLASGTLEDVQVTAGIFTVVLDFGSSLFTSNAAASLEISVRPGISTGSYTTLAPRQTITSSPFAVKSVYSASSDSLSTACVLCITDAHIGAISAEKITGVLSASQGGTGIGPTFPPADTYLRSNGAGWTVSAISATDISGVLAVTSGGTGSSSKNFVDLSTSQTVRGNKTFTGIITGNGSGLDSLNGGSLITGSVTAEKLGAGSVTTDAIREGNVTGDAISDGAISTVKIGSGAVTTPKIADGSVTKAKLAVDFRNGFDPQLVAQMRWDQLPVVPNLAEVGRTPSALAFDGTFVWVANKLDKNVMRIRISTGLIEGPPIPVGNAPAALVYDGFRSIWVANSGAGTVSRISISNAQVDMTVNAGSQPCALGSDGTLIYVGDCNSNIITRLTKNTGASVGDIIVGHKTVSFAFDGAYMYVSEPNNQITGINGNVRRIRASTGAVDVIAIAGGLNAGALAFDGTYIYVSNASAVKLIRSSTGSYENRSIALANLLSLNNNATVFDGTSLYGAGSDATFSLGNRSAVIRCNVNGMGSQSNSVPTQGTVTALVFDGTYIYAASDKIDNSSGNNVVLNGTVIRFQ
ncbi:MAG: hypothetical protein IPP63_03870 [Chloracidobacterium sp.]|nr:hypothetical protein [Chloracidobacterium sp.]